MAASLTNPTYKVVIETSKAKINVTDILFQLNLSESEDAIAQQATIGIMNIKVEGEYMFTHVDVRDMVYVYANKGSGNEEIFRGYVWTKKYTGKTQKELVFVCYDNLIYLQQSEDSVYFASGKTTKTICKSLCERWGITLKYTYDSITHKKMPLSGNLSDIFIYDLLDAVKKKKSSKYNIRSQKGTMYIQPVGVNTTIYELNKTENAIAMMYEKTMMGMVTKVVIMGPQDDNERSKVETTKTKNTDKYGTLQKILNRSENVSKSDIAAEAKEILDEYGKPSSTYQVDAIDNPFIRKGDLVKVEAGTMHGEYIVLAITHTAAEKMMTLTLEVKK